MTANSTPYNATETSTGTPSLTRLWLWTLTIASKITKEEVDIAKQVKIKEFFFLIKKSSIKLHPHFCTSLIFLLMEIFDQLKSIA